MRSPARYRLSRKFLSSFDDHFAALQIDLCVRGWIEWFWRNCRLHHSHQFPNYVRSIKRDFTLSHKERRLLYSFPSAKTSGAESYRLPVTDSCIISIFHSIFVIPQAHSYVPSVAITSILVTAKILGVKFLNQHYKSPQCFALLSPLEQKFYQAVTRGSFRHIRNSHSIGTAYLRTRM